MSGSSPLARGLLSSARRSLVVIGIIPARAGFTRRFQDYGLVGQDHPRSRGVYSSCCRQRTAPRGSSPLARGLLAAAVTLLVPLGIIPARAGFTERLARPEGCRPDHPRSRGVYTSTRANTVEPAGSSPLARGLLPQSHSLRRRAGIIPARAGFTRSRPPQWSG